MTNGGAGSPVTAAISIVAATKKADGTFETSRIDVGLNGVVPN